MEQGIAVNTPRNKSLYISVCLQANETTDAAGPT